MDKKQPAAQALRLAQAYVAAREHRLAADKVAAALAEPEKALKAKLMALLENEGLNSVGDRNYVYALVHKDEPEVKDWAEFYAHIQATGEFELLFRRVNAASIKERWDQDQKVPGIGKFIAVTLSVTKAKGAK